MGKDEPMQDRLSSWLRARAPALLAGSALVLSACATPPAAPLYQRLGGEAQIRAFMGRTLDRVAATYGAIIEAGVPVSPAAVPLPIWSTSMVMMESSASSTVS